MCWKEAGVKADPILLEPIMDVEVTSPPDYLGNVMGDLNSRRGIIMSQEDGHGGVKMRAEVPLANMFGYATSLRSATRAARPTPWNSRSTRRCRRVSPNPC